AQEAKATGSTEDEDAFLKRMADTADAVRRGGSEAPLSDADHQAAFAARSAVEQEVTKALDTAVPTDGEVDVYNAQVVPATARDRKRMLAEEVLRFRQKIEDVQEEVERLQLSNRELMNKVMTAQADNDDARLQLAKSEAAQETAEQALSDAQIELDRVSKDATAAESEVARLTAEVSSTKADIAAEEAAMEREEGELADRLARMEAEAQEREDALQADIAAAHSTLEAARAEAVELDSRLAGHAAVAAESTRLRSALVAAKAWNLHKSLVKTIKDSKAEQVRLQAILVHAQEQRAESMTALEGARSERDKLKAQLSAALAAASTAESAVASARRDMAYAAIESGSPRGKSGGALTQGGETPAQSPPAEQVRRERGALTDGTEGMAAEMGELRAMMAELRASMDEEVQVLTAEAKHAQQLAARAAK
ncbi:unnamed protein product, partial [Symbiodinium sp. KB8]